MNHTMKHKDRSETNRQGQQQAQQTQEEINKDDPMKLTDYILNFRAACLNRSVDIRNFAEGRNSFVLDINERKRLRVLTDMLTEQIEFLQDAWDTMIRCATEYDIDLDRDDAYKALEVTRDHALKVAEQAFDISDQFLFPQAVEFHDEVDEQEDDEEPNQAHSTTAEGGMNIGYPRGTKMKTISNAHDCKQAVYATIEAIATETEDVATLLLEGRTRTPKQRDRQSGTGEESNYEDPEDVINLDNMMTALEKTVENSMTNAETNNEKHTGEKLQKNRATRESTQGERNPPGRERASKTIKITPESTYASEM